MTSVNVLHVVNVNSSALSDHLTIFYKYEVCIPVVMSWCEFAFSLPTLSMKIMIQVVYMNFFLTVWHFLRCIYVCVSVSVHKPSVCGLK